MEKRGNCGFGSNIGKRDGDADKSGYTSLLDIVFSWSIQDVLNKNLYKTQVRKIPQTFSSTAEYLDSFVAPLIEETLADLLDSNDGSVQAPFRELCSVEMHPGYKAPKEFYDIVLRRKDLDRTDSVTAYQPQCGDLVALTDVRPKCLGDLNRPKMPYLLAYVENVDVANFMNSPYCHRRQL